MMLHFVCLSLARFFSDFFFFFSLFFRRWHFERLSQTHNFMMNVLGFYSLSSAPIQTVCKSLLTSGYFIQNLIFSSSARVQKNEKISDRKNYQATIEEEI